eukprot:1823266-Lingulodinium_polyedra.AAC.1
MAGPFFEDGRHGEGEAPGRGVGRDLFVFGDQSGLDYDTGGGAPRAGAAPTAAETAASSEDILVLMDETNAQFERLHAALAEA